MKPIDETLIAEFLDFVPPTKRSFATAGVGSSLSTPRALNVHDHLNQMDRVLEYHWEQLNYQNELLLQQREFQAASTQFLHDYLQRMTLQSGDDVSGYPTMPVYSDIPVAPVWGDDNDDEDDE